MSTLDIKLFLLYEKIYFNLNKNIYFNCIMNLAKQNLNELIVKHNFEKKQFYDDELLIQKYELCIKMCKEKIDYKLCMYDPNSTKYAIAEINIIVPECSEIVDYKQVIRFTDYLENDEIKKLPNNYVGLIPNYQYIIDDTFEQNNANSLRKSTYGDYYLIQVRVPFIMDL